jgi:signal transduction histidine kinase
VNYTPTDGLVNNRCRYMYQDMKGRLFITTFGGLSIYDGARFTNYTTDNGLSVSMVNDVVEMAEDSIWIILNSNKIQCLVNGKMKDIITADRFYPVVNKLIKCSDGFYYALADDGLYRFKDNRFIKIYLEDKDGALNNYFIKGAEIDGKLYILTDPSTNNLLAASRLVIFDLKTEKTIISQKPPDINYVVESPEKDILIAVSGGMKKLNRQALDEGNIVLERLPSQYKAIEKLTPSHVYFDRQQNCWLSMLTGVYKLDKAGHLKLFNIHNGLAANSIASVFQDRENIIWILNTETGMSKLSSLNFESYAQLKPEFYVLDSYADKQSDSSWFLNGNHKTLLLHDQNGFKQFYINPGIGYKIVVGKNGKGFLTDNFNVYRFDTPHSGDLITPRHVYSLPDKLKIGIQGMWIDNNGNLIFTSDTLQVLIDGKLVAAHPLGTLADQIAITENNELWTATRGDKLFHFRFHPDDPDHYLELIKLYEKELVGVNPRSITVDKHQNVWVGGRDYGLFRFSFDEKGNVISKENLTLKNGLSDNFITYLRCDEEDNIWACTPAGLDKVKVMGGKMVVENITRANNLYQYVSKIQTNKKRVHWITTNAGVIKIEPTASLPKNFHPKISFSEIKVGNDTISSRGTKVYLSYRDNQIIFQLAAPSFINEKQTRFSYRLDGGTNTNWSEPSSNSEIKLVNLAPGDYKLHVKATFPSGSYPPTQDLFQFEILPAWWQTWWFRILLICIAVAITAAFVRIYFRRKIEKQKMLLEKQQVIELERKRIAGEMHDDLGAGLTNIRFLSEKVKRESMNTSTQFDAEKLVTNSNDLAQKMNEIIWAMNEQNDTLEVLIFYSRAYAVEYCEENNLACTVTISESIPEKFVSGEIRRHIFLTIKESLHNVVKHSDATNVLIEFRLDKNLSVRISDDGKGTNFQNIRQGGKGLMNMKHRISLLNGTMNITSKDGVTVEFTVPLN